MEGIIRSEAEINEVIDTANEVINGERSGFFGQTYEDGLKAMYDWLVGNTHDNPMEL